MIISSYQDAITYVEGFVGKIQFKLNPEFLKTNDPLERMNVLLSLIGNPERKFQSVLIGGTSGKGSTAYLTSHILCTAGIKTGLLIKPHLQKINERMQINELPISDLAFTRMVKNLQPIVSKMEKMAVGAPSYFEILVALAFQYFAEEKVAIAVVEVGMGGEYDATNTLSPLIACVTNVSLDHVDVLGKTVQKIANTKAGIIKNGVELFVTGVKQPSVKMVMKKKAKACNVPYRELGNDFTFKMKKEGNTGSIFDAIRGGKTIKDIELSLIGKHQVVNAIVAIEIVFGLIERGFLIQEQAIRKGLQSAQFAGRFEIIHSDIVYKKEVLRTKLHQVYFELILDGAHNSEKMKAFLASLKMVYPKKKKIFIIAFKKGKEILPMLRKIAAVADTIIITQFHTTTDFAKSAYAAESVQDIQTALIPICEKKKRKITIYTEENPEMALKKAAIDIALDSVIAATGSLYLVGEIRQYLDRA